MVIFSLVAWGFKSLYNARNSNNSVMANANLIQIIPVYFLLIYLTKHLNILYIYQSLKLIR